jgi:acyl-CoA thioester hydrolase
MIAAEVVIAVQFYDLDPMNVVWHGNYVRYLEQARCALLDRIGYNYVQMQQSGYAFPIVDMRLKYIRPVAGLGTSVKVAAILREWENRIRIEYIITDPSDGRVLNKAQTIQMAVDAKSGETLFVCPDALREKVAAALCEG